MAQGKIIKNVKIVVAPVMAKLSFGIKCGTHNFIIFFLIFFNYVLYLKVIVKTGNAAMFKNI